MLNAPYFRKSVDQNWPEVGSSPHLLLPMVLGLSEEVYSSRPQTWSFIRENFQLYGLFTVGLLRVWYEPHHSMIIWSYNADVNCK